LVAFDRYGFSAFSRLARFLGLKSIVHHVPSQPKVTSFALAEPSRSSVTVTVVCLAMTIIITLMTVDVE
jgi:hypothetical protein